MWYELWSISEKSIDTFPITYQDLSEQWSAIIELCACSCSGVWFPACEFEFCPANDKNPLKMFEFCPAFVKKFALDKS